MAQAVLHLEALPENPLDAAALFLSRQVPQIRRDFIALPELSLAIVFKPADPGHRGWRLAAVQALARELAPGRVNGIAADDMEAIGQVVDYLENAPGVTGQLLELAGNTAQNT